MTSIAIDASALVAILEGEPEADACLRAIEAAPRRVLGAATLVEASIVVAHRRGETALVALDALIARLGILVAPFEADDASVARAAWWRYGKGRHRAALNFGDCLSYATARRAGAPLVCVGDDFPRTDLAVAR